MEAPRVTRVKFSWLQNAPFTGPYACRPSSDWARAAIAFLYQPRPWVRRVADCVMKEQGLVSNEFLSLFVRRSTEKDDELRKHGHGVPHTPDLWWFAAGITRLLGLKHIHLMTSSDSALSDVQKLAPKWAIAVAVTENERGKQDGWGGWSASGAPTWVTHPPTPRISPPPPPMSRVTQGLRLPKQPAPSPRH